MLFELAAIFFIYRINHHRRRTILAVCGNLRKELDFVNEAHNAERCARNFAAHADIHVPTIKWPLTSSRVLTMEFIDGCKITDQAAIGTLGLRVDRVCATAVNALCEMIFAHGHVHCDPQYGFCDKFAFSFES